MPCLPFSGAAAPHLRLRYVVTTALLAAACGWGASSAAHAQVLRCTHPHTGLVTYTNERCPSGQESAEIAPARSAAEQAHDDAQAQRARAAWLQSQARPLPAPEPLTTPPPHAPASSPACLSAQRQLLALQTQAATLADAQRQMERTCLGPEAYQVLERSRAQADAAQPTTVLVPAPTYHVRPPRPIPAPPAGRPPAPGPRPPASAPTIQCNVFRCVDAQGHVTPAPRPSGGQ